MVKRKPTDPFEKPNFNWRKYLQRHLAYPSVNVRDLHPIMGLRLAALFIDLENAGLTGPFGFQISSAVRTRAEQIYLYNTICLQQGRCDMVANPYIPRSSGPDQEGVLRYGSNHMAQTQDRRWGVDVGYAVDIRNNHGSWAQFHARLPQYGLDWPLKSSPYEPWHVEAFPDRSIHDVGWLPGPWPDRPGVHRPLCPGMKGGDVRKLQRQLRLTADGDFGTTTARAVRRMRRKLKLPRRGARHRPVWDKEAQLAWERSRR
jgi:hypothetical protein